MAGQLPAGTVTFLFTDVEGSTRLLHDLGEEGYAAELATHRTIFRDVFARHGGVEVDTQGDAFFVAFPTAPGALEAAAEATGRLDGAIRVRMGVHTGTPLVTDEGYVGVDVHRAARIAAAGHGGQVLVSGSTAELTRDARLVDLGEHRLKDLSRAERIFQLGAGAFPPLKTLYRTNLPVPATQFVGRVEELAEVARLLGSTRLLTLRGPGGTGKTRLALQAAASGADEFPDGVFWVPLAALRDPALVLPTITAALGVDDAGALAGKTLLLVVDNFEHVVDAAPDLAALLGAAPQVKLIVTSRELLRIPGEQAYDVPPLAPTDAEALFVARARAVVPDFAPDDDVRELCARLDSLPLAVELAAARVQILTPRQLVERLGGRLDLLKAGRGVDERQQTLRATIEWSHQLLDDADRRLFARVAVFAGGWTLDAAEAVCGADVDGLQSLVDKSLVRVREGGRFWMLETIAEFAREQLDASGEADDLRDRHARHFLELAESVGPGLRSAPPEALEAVYADFENFRAALDRLDDVSALRLVGALRYFWSRMGGHAAIGLDRVEALLATAGARPEVRAPALLVASDLAYQQNDAWVSTKHAREAVGLYRHLDDRLGLGVALNKLGISIGDVEGWETALPILEESVDVLADVEPEAAIGARRGVAFGHANLGDFETAARLHKEALDEARAVGAKTAEIGLLGSLSMTTLELGRLDEAAGYLRGNVEAASRGSFVVRAQAVCRVAQFLAVRGMHLDDAVRLVSAFDAQRYRIGVTEPWVAVLNDDTLARIRGVLDEAAFTRAWEDGRSLEIDDAVELARALI